MKLTVHILSFFVLITFFSCKTGVNVSEDTPPFEVEEATFQNHYYGAREHGMETRLTIRFSTIKEGVQPDSIFFRGNSAGLKRDQNEPLLYSASFKVSSIDKGVMHRDGAMEMDNPVPDIESDFHFILENDEAMISYRFTEYVKHFKIKNIKELQPIAYPTKGNSGNKQ